LPNPELNLVFTKKVWCRKMSFTTSVWNYFPSDFKRYIGTLNNKTLTVEDALATFRETDSLPNSLKQMLIQQVIDGHQIQRLFETLRKVKAPESKQKLSKKQKEERVNEILDNIADLYHINREKAEYKIITNQHRDKDDIRVFNYTLELVIAPYNSHDSGSPGLGTITILGNVNDSIGTDNGERYFDGHYSWFGKNLELQHSSGIRDILRQCGFTEGEYAKRKRHPSVFYINLRSRCIDWLGSAGKTHINIEPYAENIADNIPILAYKIESYRIQGTMRRRLITSETRSKDENQNAKKYMLEFLQNRRVLVDAQPSIITTDRITQSGAWYRIRPIMIDAGFKPPKSWGETRRYLTSNINKFCKELWPDENITREDLGIVASSKGVMLYDSQAYPLNIDSFKNLAEKGIVIIVIEKEGVAEALEPYARKYKIALVHTGGRFTEAAKELIEAAKNTTSIVGILVDYDAAGNDIADSTLTDTPKLGIDFDTIEWLQQNGYPDLTIESVEEEYTPSIYTSNEYLRHHRIELDSIQEKVGAEGIWKYIMYQLERPEFSPNGFDITRALNIQDDIISENRKLYPEVVRNFLQYLDSYIEKRLEAIREKIEVDELTAADKLPLFDDLKNDIEERLANAIAEDSIPTIQAIKEALENLMLVGTLASIDSLSSIEAEEETETKPSSTNSEQPNGDNDDDDDIRLKKKLVKKTIAKSITVQNKKTKESANKFESYLIKSLFEQPKKSISDTKDWLDEILEGLGGVIEK
jgi:hypothetical protein